MILDLRGNCKAGQDRPHVKVFASLFQKAAGDKRGRRPLLYSAARGARNAKQKKTVPAKNSEAIFWRPRFTRPLRAGERANANFACSEGFFCARRAAPFARGGRFFEACRCLACWLLCPVFRHFSAGVSPPCPQPAGCLLLLRLVWSALPLPAVSPPCACVCRAFAALFGSPRRGAGRCRRPAAVRETSRSHVCLLRLFFARIPRRRFPACVFCRFCVGFHTRCLFARFVLCARAFLFYFSLFLASLLPLKNFFICRSGRDGPLLSSEKKVDKDSQKGFAPLNPIPAPCGQSSPLPRCWPAYAAFRPQTAG